MKALRMLSIVALVAVVGLPAALAQTPTIEPEQAAEHVGKEVSVEGRCFVANKTRAGIHLYFSPDVSTAFQALIPMNELHKFKVDPLVRYEKRNLRVTGKIEEENGRYFIRVTSPRQIRIVRKKLGTE